MNYQPKTGQPKLKYRPASKHYRIRCNETQEEQNFTSEPQCMEWARKVANTFRLNLTFTIILAAETVSRICVYRDYQGEEQIYTTNPNP